MLSAVITSSSRKKLRKHFISITMIKSVHLVYDQVWSTPAMFRVHDNDQYLVIVRYFYQDFGCSNAPKNKSLLHIYLLMVYDTSEIDIKCIHVSFPFSLSGSRSKLTPGTETSAKYNLARLTIIFLLLLHHRVSDRSVLCTSFIRKENLSI